MSRDERLRTIVLYADEIDDNGSYRRLVARPAHRHVQFAPIVLPDSADQFGKWHSPSVGATKGHHQIARRQLRHDNAVLVAGALSLRKLTSSQLVD